MKDINNILQGFDLDETEADGTRRYQTKSSHFVQYDYWEVHHLTLYPDGNIDLSVDVNCDLFENANDLDQFHVYELTEVA